MRCLREKYLTKKGQWNPFVLGCGCSARGVLVAPTRQVIPDPEIHLLIARWRTRAQELLAQADAMLDADARLTMQEIAAKYEVLAQRVEQRVGIADKA
jgi:hypothetical protein